MITIFTTPKPFRGHAKIIQTNAILSWTRLPNTEVLLLGQEFGLKTFSKKHKLAHIPNIKHSKLGTPLINSLFKTAYQHASYPIVSYVNADIILFEDFITSTQRVAQTVEKFLIIGKRIDLEVNEEIKLNYSPNLRKLKARAKSEGVLHNAAGIDYFIHQKNLWPKIPPMGIARARWDNWLVFEALQSKASVVNATSTITAIHQNHDYLHLPQGLKSKKFQDELKINIKLAGSNLATIDNSTHLLLPSRLVKIPPLLISIKLHLRDLRKKFIHFLKQNKSV